MMNELHVNQMEETIDSEDYTDSDMTRFKVPVIGANKDELENNSTNEYQNYQESNIAVFNALMMGENEEKQLNIFTNDYEEIEDIQIFQRNWNGLVIREPSDDNSMDQERVKITANSRQNQNSNNSYQECRDEYNYHSQIQTLNFSNHKRKNNAASNNYNCYDNYYDFDSYSDYYDEVYFHYYNYLENDQH